MSAHSLAKADSLVSLVSHLLPEDFGKGVPACTPNDVDLFLVDDDDPEYAAKVEDAKAICDACPIRVSCLERALRTGDQGVLGGTTDAERAAILGQVDDTETATADVDDVVVERLMNGVPVEFTDAERAEAIRRMRQASKSTYEIARRLGSSTKTVRRLELPQCQGCGLCSRCLLRPRLAVAS